MGIEENTSYGKKASGSWYASGPSVVTGSQVWNKPSLSRKQSMGDPLEAANATTTPIVANAGKSSAGRVIRIINNADHTVQCRVLLNLRTSQPFEEVVEDLGQVLKINGAKRMYTVSGQEVRSFSQLRNEFSDVDTFYLGTVDPTGAVRAERQVRARSKSRSRILYAPENEIIKATPTDSRRNLWVLPTGELMYYVAAVAVLYDRDEDAQRHYIGHTEDIQW
ncbi:hypothetical protein U1Q18_045612 [Sarracenia purpurea var. burkii]